MNTAQRIKARRKEIGLTAVQLAEKLNVHHSTIYRYEKGEIEKVPTHILEEVARALNTTPAFLMGWEEASSETPTVEALTSTVKDLEESRVLNVLDYAKAQLEEQEKALSLTVEELATLYTVQGVTKAAAGLGYGFDDYDTYTVYTDEEPPQYDLSTMVKGDSMEPDYQDGDMLYLCDTGVRNFSGELCVVAVNDKTYFKKVYLTSDGLRLVSLNPAYEDIYIDFPPTDNDTHIKVFTVIGSFVPVKP